MSTTIPARELKAGDVIDFGGQPFTVTATKFGSNKVSIWGQLDPESLLALSALTMQADLPLNVQRPDPDAELVEVMARAYRDALGQRHNVSGWDDLGVDNQIGTRADMRAALAAAREAGLL